MASYPNSAGAAVFWCRLPFNLVMLAVAFLLLYFVADFSLFPFLGVVGTSALFAGGFFVLMQFGAHGLFVGVMTQSFSRAPVEMDLGFDGIGGKVAPFRTSLRGPDGPPNSIFVPWDRVQHVSTMGIPGAIPPFVRFTAEGSTLPPKTWFGQETSKLLVLGLTHANAQRVLTAWKAWKATHPGKGPPSSGLRPPPGLRPDL